MNTDIVLSANKLGKCFKIYPNPWHRAREWVIPGPGTECEVLLLDEVLAIPLHRPRNLLDRKYPGVRQLKAAGSH